MLKRLFSYLKPYRRATILAVACIWLETIFELVIPMIMADIIDVGVPNGDKALIFSRGILMIVCALISMIFGAGSARYSALCGQGLGAELRKAEYEKLQSFSFSNIDHFRTSSLVTRLTSDVTAIQNSVSTGMRPGCRAPFMMISALIMSFSMNWKLALIFCVASPILGILLFFIIKNVRPLYGIMQSAVDTLNRIVQENLTAIRVVKAYVRKDYETAKFEEANLELKDASQRSFGLAALNMPAMQLVMYATILCILWIGGRLIQGGSMQVGELTGFLSYVLLVLNSLMMISNVFMMLTRSLASCRRIVEVLDEPVDMTDDDARDIQVTSGAVQFDHVYFKYQESAPEYVLSDITLSIKAGQTVGILGGTGSAKSTLVQLIPRLYDITSGSLTIDGHSVREYPMEHLRDAVGMVLQKNTLFSGTITDNLRWGKEDASKEEIEEACAVACVDEFIGNLPHGYETELGQGGAGLSGGQKQRLCIARALLRHPKILILDDSTSAVDTATEARIREGLSTYLKGTTKIIIAQRITSVMHADQIVILDRGHIQAVGTHESLLKDNFIYQELYHSQQEGVGL